MKFAWTTLHVSDLDKSINFYSQIIGLSPMIRLGSDEHKVVMFGQDGTTKLELVWEAAAAPAPLGNGISIGFIPDDLDATIQKLDALGIKAIGPISPTPEVRFFFIKDPDGYTVQLFEQK